MHPYTRAFGDTVLEFTLAVGTLYSLWRWFENSRDEPWALVRKIAFSLGIIALLWLGAIGLGLKQYVDGGDNPVFALLPFEIAAAAFVLAFVWGPNIGEWVVRPLTGAFDGGHEQMESRPYYSVARGLCAKGRFEEALAYVQGQLVRFPGDFEGMLLCAEIHIEHLHDMASGEATIEEICENDGRSQNIAAALNMMADWQLKLGKDADAARRYLQRIIEEFPDTEAALGAAQRIAHLSTEEIPWSMQARRVVAVPEGVKNYGLVRERISFAPQVANPREVAAQLVAHLNNHPLDTEAREKLVTIYAEDYGRRDLAVFELEQMIAQPNAPARNVTRWLNKLADVHVRGEDYAAAANALKRIMERFPNAAAAGLARNRLELLALESKAQKKSHAVKLGSYEQNIGLKYGRPQRR